MPTRLSDKDRHDILLTVCVIGFSQSCDILIECVRDDLRCAIPYSM